MKHVFSVDPNAVVFLNEIYDECAKLYPMEIYTIAIFWTLNRGVLDENGKYVLQNKGSYSLVVAKLSDVENDDKISFAPKKNVAVRLDPRVSDHVGFQISLSDGDIEIKYTE